MNVKQMLFKVNTMFAEANFGSLEISINFQYFTWVMVRYDFYSVCIRSIYSSGIKPRNNIFEIDIFIRQCSFIECVICLEVICENFTSQMPIVHVTHNTHHLIFSTLRVISNNFILKIAKQNW